MKKERKDILVCNFGNKFSNHLLRNTGNMNYIFSFSRSKKGEERRGGEERRRGEDGRR